MAGEATLGDFLGDAKTIFTTTGNLGEKFSNTKRYRLLGGSYGETIGKDDNDKSIEARYDDGDIVESAHDLTKKFVGKFDEVGVEESSAPKENVPACIHVHDAEALCRALLDVVEAIKNPPNDSAAVALQLKQTAGIVKEILHRAQEGWTFAAYPEFATRLTSVSQDGLKAVGQVDPFAFPVDDSGPKEANPKRRGRPKANYETIRHETTIATDWNQAKENGVHKADFVKEKEWTLKEFNKLLDRVSKRNSRSDK